MRQKSYTIVSTIIISGMILLGAFKPEASSKDRAFVYSNEQSNTE